MPRPDGTACLHFLSHHVRSSASTHVRADVGESRRVSVSWYHSLVHRPPRERRTGATEPVTRRCRNLSPSTVWGYVVQLAPGDRPRK